MEEQTSAAPTKKELATLAALFDDVTMDVTGDVREYNISNNKVYIAAKYDSNRPSVTLPDALQTKVDNMKTLACYLDFEDYVTNLADENLGDYVITFASASDAIYDYLNYGMVIDAYMATLDTSDKGQTYWYDSATMTSAEAATAITTANGSVSGLFATTPMDARDVANKTDFATLARTVKAGSSGALNTYIASKAYSAIIKDAEAGYIESPDYAQLITNYSTLNTALNNIANEIKATAQLANVANNTLREIDNSAKTNTITEVRPLTVRANEWTNIGMLYTSTSAGMPLITQLNSLIGENRGVKLIVNVDPTTLPNTTMVPNMNGYMYTPIGAARLRVNGAFAMTVNDMASFDSNKNTFTFDWDAITNNISTGLWSLEFTAYNALGINSITISVPEQEAYLAAIGADETEESKGSTDNNNVGSLSAGEGITDETEELNEEISEDIQSDEGDVGEDNQVTPNEPILNIPDNNTVVIDGSIDIGDGTNKPADKPAVENPSTGTKGTDMVADVAACGAACAAAIFGILRKKLLK